MHVVAKSGKQVFKIFTVFTATPGIVFKVLRLFFIIRRIDSNDIERLNGDATKKIRLNNSERLPVLQAVFL